MTDALYEVRAIIDGLQFRSAQLPMDEAVKKAELWRAEMEGASIYIKKIIAQEEIGNGNPA